MEDFKEKLLTASKAFNERLKEIKEEDKIKLMERYNNFLFQLEVDGEEEIKFFVEKVREFYYTVYLLLNRSTLIMKEISTNWNPSLVARTFEFVKEFTSIKKKNPRPLSDDKLAIKLGHLLIFLNSEKDFPSKAFCIHILQSNNVVDFSFKEEASTEKKEETPIQYVVRPGCSSDIKDYGMKYYHLDAKEWMTYDECTKRGLGHHLLYRKENGQLIGMGFYEPDPSKIERVKRADAEWVEQVMVVPE